MKRTILTGALVLMAGSLLAADSKDEVISAAKKLAGKDNYSWKQTIENANGGGFGAGTSEGKFEKSGCLFLSMTFRDNTIEAFRMGKKGAIKTQDGWQSLADAGGGDPGPAMFIARRVETFKVPAEQAEELAGKVKDLKQDGDVYSGDLTEDGAKSLLAFRMRDGNGPDVSGAKGTIKFWVKDGQLAKYETHVKGSISFNGNDRDVDRTTTIEVKDVGSTKIQVPDEAKKKME